MGYNKANKFLTILEEFGIIPKQKKGAKLPRTVYQDKAKEFLEANGYNDDGSKKASNHAPGVDEIEVDTEPVQEENIEAPIEAEDVQKPARDLASTLLPIESHQRQQQEVVNSGGVTPQMKKDLQSIIEPNISPKHYRGKKKKSTH